MPGGPVYLLDSSVFIEAYRRYYPFDIVPGFWQGLLDHASGNGVRSIDRVRKELENGRDELAAWASGPFAPWFLPTDDTGNAYGRVMEWVQTQPQFTDAAKAEFAGVADGWLVAYAAQYGCLVVTQETLRPDVRKRVPIPNVCHAFGTRWLNTFEMLRNLGVRL